MEDLPKCPTCGCKVGVDKLDVNPKTGKLQIVVECSECGGRFMTELTSSRNITSRSLLQGEKE